MATHCSTLAWRIPWTEEPGGLQSMGSQSQTRLSDFTFTFSSSDGEESTCNVGDLGSTPGLGRPSGGRYGNPLQYSCLENPHGHRSLTGCSSQGRKESDTTEQLSTAQHMSLNCKSEVIKFKKEFICSSLSTEEVEAQMTWEV